MAMVRLAVLLILSIPAVFCSLCDSPSHSLDNVIASRKALLVGVNDANLTGSHIATDSIKKMLIKRYGYSIQDIRIMANPSMIDLFSEIRGFVTSSKAGDRLLFYFSGHGASVPDTDGDELDNKDEVLVTSDGWLLDDDLNRVLVGMVPNGVHVISIIQACHSGTILDLPLENHGSGWFPSSRAALTKRVEIQASAFIKTTIICLSACKDNEVSFGPGRNTTEEDRRGFFTRMMVDMLQTGSISYYDILQRAVNYNMRYSGEDPFFLNWTSTVVLTANSPFNLKETHLSL